MTRNVDKRRAPLQPDGQQEAGPQQSCSRPAHSHIFYDGIHKQLLKRIENRIQSNPLDMKGSENFARLFIPRATLHSARKNMKTYFGQCATYFCSTPKLAFRMWGLSELLYAFITCTKPASKTDLSHFRVLRLKYSLLAECKQKLSNVSPQLLVRPIETLIWAH